MVQCLLKYLLIASYMVSVVTFDSFDIKHKIYEKEKRDFQILRVNTIWKIIFSIYLPVFQIICLYFNLFVRILINLLAFLSICFCFNYFAYALINLLVVLEFLNTNR